MYEGISIIKIANGVIVHIPISHVAYAEVDMFRRQARAMKEEFTGDDVLNRISREQEQENAAPKFDLQSREHAGQYYFQTLAGALEFLGQLDDGAKINSALKHAQDFERDI